jgi:hypothetical protein
MEESFFIWLVTFLTGVLVGIVAETVRRLNK